MEILNIIVIYVSIISNAAMIISWFVKKNYKPILFAICIATSLVVSLLYLFFIQKFIFGLMWLFISISWKYILDKTIK